MSSRAPRATGDEHFPPIEPETAAAQPYAAAFVWCIWAIFAVSH